MKLLLNIFLLLSFAPFYSELQAQCTVSTSVISDYNGQDISCHGASDGVIIAQGSGGTAPYTYLWDNPTASTNDTIWSLNAGLYKVTVTDDLGCTVIDSITLTEPIPIFATINNLSNSSCFGTCDATADVIAFDGTPPYVYLWDAAAGSQTTQMATGLCAGTYFCFVTDANGCIADDIVIITEPTAVIASITSSTNPSSSFAFDGSATATATGGAAPYTYLWPTGATTSTATGLGSGTYCVTVVDVNGCQSSSCVTLIGGTITLRGVIRLDSNNNCLPDTTEPLIASQVIKTTNNSTGAIEFFTTNNQGLYEADLDTGTYTLEYFPINNLYGNSCTNIQITNISSLNTVDTVNWVVETGTPCHLMTVSIAAPFLRRTGGGSNYSVHYSNNGTVDAYNSYVEVSIDSLLTVTSTSVPISSQSGNTYRFNLDTVAVGETGTIYIGVVVDPSAIIGQTHCSQAHIYPDSLCLPLWNGAILRANSTCQNDTVFFKIKNTGSNMLTADNYFIFEDDIIINLAPFNLNSGDSIVVTQAADLGKTYRIQTHQANGFPPQLGPTIVHAQIEGCRPFNNGNFNIGFLTQYYTGNSASFIDIDCQQNIASFDPNDKSAQTVGYGASHYIEANTPLSYKIRFQNTGTDTAFNIVILDTLSTNVDPASLQMGASSHAYTWELSGAGILTVSFEDILLVDSNANEPLSHGFFTYNINQIADLANGSVINNQAAIYFDYNPPIFTNTTFHTIGENYVPIILNMEEAWVEAMQVHLYPNPTSGLVYMEQLSEEDTQIKVLDNLGRVVLQQNTKDKTTTIDLNQLPQGLYYINIQQEEKVSTHKVIKH